MSILQIEHFLFNQLQILDPFFLNGFQSIYRLQMILLISKSHELLMALIETVISHDDYLLSGKLLHFFQLMLGRNRITVFIFR